MKNQKSILIILFVSILSFSSCKDDDDASGNPATAEQTNTEKLCGKNFILSDLTYIQDGVTLITGLDNNITDPCDLDNIRRFETTGTFTVDEGATKCDPNDDQTNMAFWAFYDSETKLILDFYDTTNIITNNGTVLTLSRTTPVLPGAELIYTYTAQ